MLREIKETRQLPGEPHRRWFADDVFDLIVWNNPPGEIVGFQLCYRDPGEEHALTWMRDKGFSHDGVDDGEAQALGPKMTPILVPDGKFDRNGILARFEERAGKIDPVVAAFVVDLVGSYPGKAARVPDAPMPTQRGPRSTVKGPRPTVRGIRPTTRGPIPTAQTIRKKTRQ